jgi:hypothetical protein
VAGDTPRAFLSPDGSTRRENVHTSHAAPTATPAERTTPPHQPVNRSRAPSLDQESADTVRCYWVLTIALPPGQLTEGARCRPRTVLHPDRTYTSETNVSVKDVWGRWSLSSRSGEVGQLPRTTDPHLAPLDRPANPGTLIELVLAFAVVGAVLAWHVRAILTSDVPRLARRASALPSRAVQRRRFGVLRPRPPHP